MSASILHVHLFGTARIDDDQQASLEFPTEKVKLLFYYLVLFHQNEHPRAVLQGLFWGDRPEERAQHSLRTELWRLRRWLKSLSTTTAPELVIQDSQIGMRLGRNCWLDTFEFEQYLKQANRLHRAAPAQAAAARQQAVNLYDGDLLHGCYEDWCLVERERLRQLYLDALWQLLCCHDERREYAQAIHYGQRILVQEPLREDVHRQLIMLYAHNNQLTQALSQYQTCAAALERELHVEPEPETQELFHRLLVATYAPPAPTTRALPPGPPTDARQIRQLAFRVERALEQLEATRQELDETLQSLEQLRREVEAGTVASQKP